MDDPELDAIRTQRLSQLSQSGDADAKQKQAREAAEQQETIKNSILSQVLDQQAMVRLSNIAAAKPEKAQRVENLIVEMARRGQIAGKLNDESLRQLLDRISEQTKKTTTVKFDRRRAAIDSDSE